MLPRSGQGRNNREPFGRVVQGEPDDQQCSKRGLSEGERRTNCESLSEIVKTDAHRDEHRQNPSSVAFIRRPSARLQPRTNSIEQEIGGRSGECKQHCALKRLRQQFGGFEALLSTIDQQEHEQADCQCEQEVHTASGQTSEKREPEQTDDDRDDAHIQTNQREDAEETGARPRRLDCDGNLFINGYLTSHLRGDFAEVVRAVTDGDGADVVYDGVGAATIEKSLLATRKRGTCVLYGAASGPVTTLDTSLMQKAGSIFLHRPGLADYLRDGAEYRRRMADLFEWRAAGALKPRIGGEWPLEGVGEALTRITSGNTTGKLLIRV